MIQPSVLRNLLIALAVTTVAVNLLFAASSSSKYCSLCHGRQAAGLEKSEHKTMRCNSCHQRNDVADVFAWRMDVLAMLPRQFAVFEDKTPIADIARDNCLRCHKDIVEEVVERKGIRVSHREINDVKTRCTACHSTIAHDGMTLNQKKATMDACVECHDGKKASAKCETCHVKTVDKRERTTTAWTVTHGPNWKRLHGMGDLQTCQVCHAPTQCKRCHNTVLPHPDFWVRLHPKDAKADVEGCYKCHHQNYCTSCHGLEMPHRSSFLKEHPDVVEKKKAGLCYKCHLESSCVACHDRHRHPGIDLERLKELKRGAGID